MKVFLMLVFLGFSTLLFSQTLIPNVEFVGNKVQILTADKENLQVSGTLSSGEIIKTGCSGGACFFRIEYKGRVIEQIIGDAITKLIIYQYDFGDDGDNEIVVVNDFFGTVYIFIYSYSGGHIQTLFEKEIMNYRIVLKKDYIEFYLPGGLVSVWNYFQGQFWEMTPFEITNN